VSGRLAGHVAAVTGGAQGIGRAHAARLAAQGGSPARPRFAPHLAPRTTVSALLPTAGTRSTRLSCENSVPEARTRGVCLHALQEVRGRPFKIAIRR
jgi:hypothetical protein